MKYNFTYRPVDLPKRDYRFESDRFSGQKGFLRWFLVQAKRGNFEAAKRIKGYDTKLWFRIGIERSLDLLDRSFVSSSFAVFFNSRIFSRIESLRLILLIYSRNASW